MSSVTVITPPDDILDDANRLLLVDLSVEQLELVSNALIDLDFDDRLITYIWKIGEDISWLIDKKLKSNIVIFNAESENQLIVGYMIGKKNSFYLGNLRDLNIINNSRINDKQELVDILNKVISNEQISK